ncbi:MAG: DUF4286 family protein [Bacteroidetes bacterium]|nr:DUF4286 family protein [Bacteroidota bacterium]
MLLYNITVAIDVEVEQRWVQWMKGDLIPLMVGAGLLSDSRLYKVVTHDDPHTSSYCIQYFFESSENLNRYVSEYAPVFIQQLQSNFPNQHAVFQTLLEEV